MGRIQTTFFAQSLSNFTCKLWMIRGGTLLILGHGVKGKGQLCPPARGCHALRCLVVFNILVSITASGTEIPESLNIQSVVVLCINHLP